MGMHDRDTDFDDLVAALFWGAITESEFMRRATHEHDLDWYEAVELIVKAREAEAGNG